MQHDQIWAPWRLSYIQGTDRPPQTPDEDLTLFPGGEKTCFLCRGVVDSADRQNLVVYRSTLSFIVMNRYPYNNGHLLIAPKLHKARLDQLSAEEHLDCMTLLARMTNVLETILKPGGFNIGLNLGQVAGAGVPGHLHWHIVPRWAGDNSFMPVLAGVRVLPQSLDSLWEALVGELANG